MPSAGEHLATQLKAQELLRCLCGALTCLPGEPDGSALPSAGLGKIKARDNAALWGTDAECKLRQPDDPFYKKFAAECSRVQIAVDIFAMGCASPLPYPPKSRRGVLTGRCCLKHVQDLVHSLTTCMSMPDLARWSRCTARNFSAAEFLWSTLRHHC